MMEFTNAILTDSIGYMLHKEFGDRYKYHKHFIPQKLERPMFFVRRVSNINTKQLSSDTVFRESNLITMVVRFFPEEVELIPNVDAVWEIEGKLLRLFRYIDLTLDGEEVSGQIVVHSITTEEVDGSLQLTMDLRVNTIELTDKQKVKAMTLYQNIKEE